VPRIHFSSVARSPTTFVLGPDAGDAAVEQAARLANAHEFITATQGLSHRDPGGVSTCPSANAAHLHRRVVLADPRILILDEARPAWTR